MVESFKVSKDEIFWLYIMQALTEPLLGFVNGVIYGAASYKAILVRFGTHMNILSFS